MGRVHPVCTEKGNNSHVVVRAQKEQARQVRTRSKKLARGRAEETSTRQNDMSYNVRALAPKATTDGLPSRGRAQLRSPTPMRPRAAGWVTAMGPFPGQSMDLSSLDWQLGLPRSAPGPLSEPQGPCCLRPAHGTHRPHHGPSPAAACPWEGWMVLGRLRDTSSGRQPSVGPGGAGQNRTATPPLPSPRFSALPLWKCPRPGGGVFHEGHAVRFMSSRVGCHGAHRSEHQGQTGVLLRRGAGRSRSGILRHTRYERLSETPGIIKGRPTEDTDWPGMKLWVPVQGEEARGAGELAEAKGTGTLSRRNL